MVPCEGSGWLMIEPCVWRDGNGAIEGVGSEKAAGGGIEPPQSGWKPFGELRLRMLRAPSMSSHDLRKSDAHTDATVKARLPRIVSGAGGGRRGGRRIAHREMGKALASSSDSIGDVEWPPRQCVMLPPIVMGADAHDCGRGALCGSAGAR